MTLDIRYQVHSKTTRTKFIDLSSFSLFANSSLCAQTSLSFFVFTKFSLIKVHSPSFFVTFKRFLTLKYYLNIWVSCEWSQVMRRGCIEFHHIWHMQVTVIGGLCLIAFLFDFFFPFFKHGGNFLTSFCFKFSRLVFQVSSLFWKF